MPTDRSSSRSGRPQNSVRSAGRSAVERGRSVDKRNDGRPADSKRSSRTRAAKRQRVSVDGSELERSVGKERARRLQRRVEEATSAYLEERYVDAGDILRPIAKEAPDVPMVRELLGLVYYRKGQWKSAVRELEAFVELTNGSVEQNPVLADCFRALGKHADVDRLVAELGAVSPSAELMTEGRIVRAGSLADRGELAQAIDTLEKNRKAPKKAKDHHLRRAYALADLYEQAGEIPRARSLLTWIVSQDPDFADAAERL